MLSRLRQALIFVAAVQLAQCFSPEKSFVLECEFKNEHFWQIGTLYECSGSFAVDDSSWEGHFENVTGLHNPGKSDGDVRGLKIFHQKSSYIPIGLDAFLPNLEAFWTEFCDFTHVSRKDFEPFPKLKQVHFYGHKIQTLDADLFLSNPLIEHVSFGGNPLKHIGYGIFDNLKSLQSLYLENAGCASVPDASASNDRVGVLKLIKRLEASCPPSSHQVDCTAKTDKEFEENVLKMSWKIIEMDYAISQQEDRIKHLEKELKKMSLDQFCSNKQ